MHVILLILKILGLAAAVLLGLILVIVLLVLFVPVRYRLSGTVSQADGKTAVKGRVSWLFHLLSFTAGLEEDLYYGLRLLGIPVWPGKKKKTEEAEEYEECEESGNPEETERPGEQKKDGAHRADGPVPLIYTDLPESENPEGIDWDLDWGYGPGWEEEEKPGRSRPGRKGAGRARMENEENGGEAGEEKESFSEKVKGLRESAAERIKALKEKAEELKDRIRTVPVRMKDGKKKIRLWIRFLQKPETFETVRLVWDESKGLLIGIRPR